MIIQSLVPANAKSAMYIERNNLIYIYILRQSTHIKTAEYVYLQWFILQVICRNMQ